MALLEEKFETACTELNLWGCVYIHIWFVMKTIMVDFC